MRLTLHTCRRGRTARVIAMISLISVSSLILTTYLVLIRTTNVSIATTRILAKTSALLWPGSVNNPSSSSNGVGQTCIHPKLQLWHPEMTKYFQSPKPLLCNNTEDNWVYTANGSLYILDKAVTLHGQIDCKSIPILRGEDDYTLRRSDTIKRFKSGDVLASDVFEARCVAADGAVQASVFSGIAPDDKVRQRVREIPLPKTALGLDILMFGFDSVSRMTWMRNLPKSYAYFTEVLDAVVLEGYNIVGDGTPQALLPILTGKTEMELPEARRGFAKARTVDNHPWIWKDLQNIGYSTQWGEDSAGFGTFTFRMLGFKDQPVDHYMRTFYLAETKHHNTKHSRFCLGSLPIHKNMMNWMRDFVDVYSSQRKFSFVFHADYTHGGYSELKLADEDLLLFLKYLHDRGHLDNALLILMSDHGARFQKLRNTEQGKYEERMPFMGLRLPPSFVASHPIAAKNLRLNAGRLTTPFDIYATFRDIVNYSGDVDGAKEEERNLRGISLFHEISKERTCEDASIEPHWCTCLTWRDVPVTDPNTVRAAKEVIQTINKATSTERQFCLPLALAEVTKAAKYVANEKILRFKQSSDRHGRVPDLTDNMNVTEVLYQMTMRTTPGDGLFEATVRHTLLDDKYSVELSVISRINKYGLQPHCVKERLPHLRPYCYCKVQLPGST